MPATRDNAPAPAATNTTTSPVNTNFFRGLIDRGSQFIVDHSLPQAYDAGLSTKKVMLIPTRGGSSDGVVFDVTPTLSEAGAVIYSEVGTNGMTRQPASMLMYQTTPSREFSINAKFVSRTKAEAERTFRDIHLLKSWRMPDNGYSGASETQSPNIINLYAYGRMIRGVPTVMTNLGIEYPDDVDTIDIGHTKIPIIQTVSIQLRETRTIFEIGATFDIAAFRNGTLPLW